MKELGEILDDIEETARKTGNEALELAKQVKKDLKEMAEKSAGKAKEKLDEIAEKVEELADKTGDEADELAKSIKKELIVRVVEPKFEVFKDSAGEYRFRLKAENWKIIAASQGYTTKAACLHGIEAINEKAPIANVVDLTKSK